MKIDRGSMFFLFLLAALRFAAAAESPTIFCFLFTVFRAATWAGGEVTFLLLGALLVWCVERVDFAFCCVDSSFDIGGIETST